MAALIGREHLARRVEVLTNGLPRATGLREAVEQDEWRGHDAS